VFLFGLLCVQFMGGCDGFLFAGLAEHRIRTLHDEREFEPLKTHKKEFFTSCEMALLDLQPQAIWPILQKDFPKNFDHFEYILSQLYASPGSACDESFRSLWPGALELLEENCPSLKDPEKGGVFSLKYLTNRALTMEMLEEITTAWLKWPFRPSRYDLMNRTGSSTHDSDIVSEETGF
jgi:mitochondrial transcription factor 1